MQTSKLGTTLILALSILGLTDARAAGTYVNFAATSGHPGIDKVPWALWGHSGGGIWSDVMTTLHPNRVIGVWMRSGSALMFLSHPEFTRPEVPAALCRIPMMTNPGVKEKPKSPPPHPDTRTEGEKMKGGL